MEDVEKNSLSESLHKENKTMKKRQRKKWLKKHGKYIPCSDLCGLDVTIAKFVLPRLRKFKKKSMGYPGIGEMNTPEKWDEALDKMMLAFEYVLNWDEWWIDNPRYDFFNASSKEREKIRNAMYKERKRRQAVIDEGLLLFAKWFQYLQI